jgi:predicted metalloprotease with PDZ domain
VFEACNVPSLLDRTIEGYHTTLFAYGQTGAGKTYTMEGYDYSFDKQKSVPKPIFKVIDVKVLGRC